MPAVQADQFRAELLALAQAGRAYEFLPRAEAYLTALADDAPVRLVAAREYLKLGLVLPAQELLQQAEARGVCTPELQSVAAQVAQLPGGLVPWTKLMARFRANLAALAARGVHTAAIEAAWNEEAARYQLFRDRLGRDQVRRRGDDGRWTWVPFLGDHEAVDDARALPEEVAHSFPGPYVFEGLDLGFFFERVYRGTQNSFLNFSCALYVVEPDPAALALVLHLRDWAELLADPRVMVFTDPDAAEQLCALLEREVDLPIPRRAYTLSGFRPGCRPTTVEAVRALAEQRQQDVEKSFAEVERVYAGRGPGEAANALREALAGRRSLRVLSAVSVHTTFLKHSMRDIVSALESQGHACLVLSEHNNHEVISPLSFHRAIRAFKPDLFLALDHLRPEFAGVIPTGLPMLTWDQDQLPHVFTAENIRRVGPCDFIVGFSKPAFVRCGGNPRQFLHARIPTSPAQFDGPPLTAEETARYACDVSYVSHASQTPAQFHDTERRQFGGSPAAKLLDAIYELLPDALRQYRVVDWDLPGMVLEQASQRTGIHVTDDRLRDRLMWWYIWRLGDRIFRHEALEWAAEWARSRGRSLRIYGNGWDRHPTLAAFAAGPAHNGRELLCIYRASKINLQLMPAGFIHQRALDGLAAGGFFQARLTPHDLRGRTLRRLVQYIERLGVGTTRDLLTSPDEELRATLQAYIGDWLHRYTPQRAELLPSILNLAEVPHPDEIFPRFGEIVFDSAEQFAAQADRFLADDAARAAVAAEMRGVVLERLTYQAAMLRFLSAMHGYLSLATQLGASGGRPS